MSLDKEIKLRYNQSEIDKYVTSKVKSDGTMRSVIDRETAEKRTDLDIGDKIIFKLGKTIYAGQILDKTLSGVTNPPIIYQSVVWGSHLNSGEYKRGQIVKIDNTFVALLSGNLEDVTTDTIRYCVYNVSSSIFTDGLDESLEDVKRDGVFVMQKNLITVKQNLIQKVKCPECSNLEKNVLKFYIKDKKTYFVWTSTFKKVFGYIPSNPIKLTYELFPNGIEGGYESHLILDYYHVGDITSNEGDGCVGHIDIPSNKLSYGFPSGKGAPSITIKPQLQTMDKYCSVNITFMEMECAEWLISDELKKKEKVFDAYIKSLLEKFPVGITTLAKFKNEYKVIFPGKFYIEYLNFKNKTKDCEYLYSKYRTLNK
jgi:hypothetical protein